jgi:HAD superfamily hydrolase (TIGR01509 family)
MTLAELDAVTTDAYGTLATVVDPVSALHELLPDHDRAAIEHAFHTEGDFYREHAAKAETAETLAAFRARCTAVFNETLGSSLTPGQYVGALRFELVPGAAEALERLRSLGLGLGVVANWDYGLHEWLDRLGIARLFGVVVPAAGKPRPDGIAYAVRALRVAPGRTLHVGDEDADAVAASAAGVRFAPAPLDEVVASLA